MNREDEARVREIVKATIEKELSKEKTVFEKMVANSIKDSEKKQMEDFLSQLKKEIEGLNNKFLTKKQIKDLMIAAFVKQNKFMWEKSKFVTSYFNEL